MLLVDLKKDVLMVQTWKKSEGIEVKCWWGEKSNSNHHHIKSWFLWPNKTNKKRTDSKAFPSEGRPKSTSSMMKIIGSVRSSVSPAKARSGVSTPIGDWRRSHAPPVATATHRKRIKGSSSFEFGPFGVFPLLGPVLEVKKSGVLRHKPPGSVIPKRRFVLAQLVHDSLLHLVVCQCENVLYYTWTKPVTRQLVVVAKESGRKKKRSKVRT